MRVAPLLFTAGALVGFAASFLAIPLDLSPPAGQETFRVEVSVTLLNPHDEWLRTVRFQVILLAGIKSRRHYSILLMTPPSGGVHPPTNTSTTLNLVRSDLIQPVGIRAADFGPSGDQPVLKFIDEGYRIDSSNYYNKGQQLTIRSQSE